MARLECWLVFAITGALVLHVGSAATCRHGLVNWDGLSALAHAFDVVYKEPTVNLSLIGFVEPPAPALIYLPLAGLFPTLAQSGYATVIFGAILLGLCAVLLDALTLRLGLGWWLRYPLLGFLILHPIALSYAALGSPVVLLLFAVLGMAKSLASWGDARHLRDLIGCSLYAAIALLTRYEAVFLVVAAALYIGFRSALSAPEARATSSATAVGSAKPVGSYSRVEGTLIMFLLPVAYFGGVWIGANWLIMGDPWHSLAATFAGAVPVPDLWTGAVIIVPLLVFPLCYALAYHELRLPGPWHGGAGVALLMVAAVGMPLVWPSLYANLSDGLLLWGPLASVTVVMLAGSLVLAAVIAARYLQRTQVAAEKRRPLVGTVFLAAASIVILILMGPMGARLPASATDVLRGYVAFAHSATGDREAAAMLAKHYEEGRQVVIAGWPGFALALYSGCGNKTNVLAEAGLDEKVASSLQVGDMLVLFEGEKAWEQAMRYYTLEPEWLAGRWTGFRVKKRSNSEK
jgi:hypothetical protein